MPAAAPAWQARTSEVAAGIRLRVFEHVLANNEGYLSQACSAAEMLAMLYTRTLRLAELPAPIAPGRFTGVPGRGNPGYQTGAVYHGEQAPDRDRFIFSPAQYALALYATLIEVGRLAPDGLDRFNEDGSTVEMIGAEHSPGIETTTGSLAQALSQAAGIALARRLRGDTGNVWVMMSDGEFEEGQTWEAIANAVFHRIDNLRVIVDVNGQQCDGLVTSVANLDRLPERVRAFGASCEEVDGHDLDALDAAMRRETPGLPHIVLCRTDPTRGVPLLAEKAPLLHTLRFASAEEKARYQAAFDAMAAEHAR
ncbi:MAG TPA: 1-deoxy-D-xylulose-5-phosphate synthase N-terminal domain-containing protein [Candidatus Limnocylindrales bacterium]|nr:1-deoxy-D-xylulose-5-phosphate synthase N-terminal domain-containing protein [Candidatus Limnocylindrales bacterium]